jgi:hypothetical protein
MKKLMLCPHCYGETNIAYNELCFKCYKRIGRMPRQAKRLSITEVVSA